MKGLVTKSTGSWCMVRGEEGINYECRMKGKFRNDGIKSTNPVAVGDKVEFQMEKDGKGIIDSIEPRNNYIIRKATNLSKQTHIIAVNMDQAILVVSLVFPETLTGFIDRFLVTAEAYSIPPLILFNKIDLYNPAILEKLRDLERVYTSIGYPCISVSAEKEINLEAIKNVLKGKISLLAGNSGVGKTTLINKLEPGFDLKTGIVSQAHHMGIHTTTFAEMFELNFGGFVIDTPGLKSFGIVDFQKEELFHYFPEMFGIVGDCKFGNCTHINEPGCAVKKALEKGEIAPHRYENYLNIYNGDEMEVKYE